MNRNEWCIRCSENWNSVDHTYDYRSRQIQLSLKYNTNPKATVRHHLMDTPEQIEYNNAHYELWGFNEDGTFEYGKYIIFVTQEEHGRIHSVDLSGENNPMYGKRHTTESKLKMRAARTKWWTPDRKAKRSLNQSGKNSPRYGKHHTDEAKHKMSKSQKGHSVSPTTRRKISIANKGKRHINRKYSPEMKSHFKDSYTGRNRYGENNPFYGKHHTDETKQKISNANKGRLSGDSHPMYGKHHTEESRLKMSESAKNRPPMSDETKFKIGNASRGRPNAMKGKHITDKTKENIRKAKEVQMNMRSKWYKKYKSLGGNLSWNDFQKMIPLHTDELVNKSMEETSQND